MGSQNAGGSSLPNGLATYMILKNLADDFVKIPYASLRFTLHDDG